MQFTFIEYVFCAQEYGNQKSAAIFTQQEAFFEYLQKGNFDSPKNKLNAISDFPNSEHPMVTSPLYTTVYIAPDTEFRILMMTVLQQVIMELIKLLIRRTKCITDQIIINPESEIIGGSLIFVLGILAQIEIDLN